jgi:orotidine-5'-phosphate decarboxylase
MPPPLPAFLALDLRGTKEALALAKRLSPYGLTHVKLGMSLFYEGDGLALLRDLRELGVEVFVDLKLHDIPQTVARTTSVLVEGGANFLNVHCSGGRHMMTMAREAANAAADKIGVPIPTLLGVTVLTSSDQTMLRDDLRIDYSVASQVEHLARLAKASGMDGVVCSAHEASLLRDALGDKFYKVTPGIRPASYAIKDDQSRVMTPQRAKDMGATHLVIGRPIYDADDPEQAWVDFLASTT